MCARERVRARKSKSTSWYLDAELLAGYWEGASGSPRAYHHTAPVTMVAALAAGLRAVLDEGCEVRFAEEEVEGEEVDKSSSPTRTPFNSEQSSEPS